MQDKHQSLSKYTVQQFNKEYPEIENCNFSVGQPAEENTWGKLSDNGSHMMAFTLKFNKKTERKRGIQLLADDGSTTYKTTTVNGEYYFSIEDMIIFLILIYQALYLE